jgi:hypothetical protein
MANVTEWYDLVFEPLFASGQLRELTDDETNLLYRGRIPLCPSPGFGETAVRILRRKKEHWPEPLDVLVLWESMELLKDGLDDEPTICLLEACGNCCSARAVVVEPVAGMTRDQAMEDMIRRLTEASLPMEIT